MMENLLMTSSSKRGGDLATWEIPDLPTTPSQYSTISAGATVEGFRENGITTEYPFAIGGWRSDTKEIIPIIRMYDFSSGFQTKITDALRIGAEPVVISPSFKRRGINTSAYTNVHTWTTQDILPDMIISYQSSMNIIGRGGATPTNSANGFSVTYLGPQQSQPDMFIFSGAGAKTPSDLKVFNRVTGVVVSTLTGIQSHGEYPRSVVSLDGRTAYIIGGCSADGASGFVTSFDMLDMSKAASGPIVCKKLAPMPVPASRGVAYLDNDGDTITYIGGNMLGGSKDNSLILDESSDLIQRYSISKNEWSIDDVRFPKKLVCASLAITSDARYIFFGQGNPENTIYKSLRSVIN